MRVRLCWTCVASTGCRARRFYAWKSKYGGLRAIRGPAASRARGREYQTEAAVGRGDARQCGVEGSAWKKMVTLAARREAVAHLRGSPWDERAASVRDHWCGPDEHSVSVAARRRHRIARAAARAAQQRRRFGYRRLHILLLRDGVKINRKKTQRLYTEEELTVRKRKSRRRAVGARAPLPVIARPNECWSLDFVQIVSQHVV